METGENLLGSSGSLRRARIEIFSAFLKYEFMGPNELFGVVILGSCNHNFPISDSSFRGPQGLLTLTNLKCSVPVENEVHLASWFINGLVCSMFYFENVLWNACHDDMDRLICREFDSFPSELHVNFAVYRDPVEVHFDVYFVDLKCREEEEVAALIHVGGTLSASNSSLPDPEAKSYLFLKLGRDCVSLKAGKSVPLPLSRKMTVIPRHSTLLVHMDLKVCNGSHGDPLTFEDTVKFNPSLDYAEEFVILPDFGKLLVKVTRVECEDRPS